MLIVYHFSDLYSLRMAQFNVFDRWPEFAGTTYTADPAGLTITVQADDRHPLPTLRLEGLTGTEIKHLAVESAA